MNKQQAATGITPDQSAPASQAGTVVDLPPPASNENNATAASDNVSKKDLMEILGKMNKKVKVLSLQRQQLTEKVTTLQTEKDGILKLVQDEILNCPADSTEIPALQAAWRQQEEQAALTLSAMQSEFQKQCQQATTAGDANSNLQWEQEKEEMMKKWQEEKQLLIQAQTELQQQIAQTNLSELKRNYNQKKWEEEKQIMIQSQTELQEQLVQAVEKASAAEQTRQQLADLQEDYAALQQQLKASQQADAQSAGQKDEELQKLKHSYGELETKLRASQDEIESLKAHASDQSQRNDKETSELLKQKEDTWTKIHNESKQRRSDFASFRHLIPGHLRDQHSHGTGVRDAGEQISKDVHAKNGFPGDNAKTVISFASRRRIRRRYNHGKSPSYPLREVGRENP